MILRVPSVSNQRAHWPAMHAPNRGESSGAVTKSPSCPKRRLPPVSVMIAGLVPAGVVAEAGLVERRGHEAVEADPAALLGNARQQAEAQLLARLQGVGIGYGERIHPPIVESPG